MRDGKRALALLSLALSLSLCACGAGSAAAPESADETQEAETPVTARVAALKGPTAMGLVRLMDDAPEAANAPLYDFTLAGSADEVTPKLLKGEIDIACIPANLASVLYNRTDGGIVTLAVNTLGVLYIVENGGSVQSVGDLAGKTIVGAGKGSTPEYALRYLLEQNGLRPDSDLTVDWKSEHSECVAALASGAADIALLPQPFVTVAQEKIAGLRVALDLNAEWNRLGTGSALITGVAVARRDFAAAHPAAVNTFLSYYAESVDWVNTNTAGAAALIGKLGIVDAAVAEKALPQCNIVCITGSEMAQKLSGYLAVLYEAAPESIGGREPQDDFYWK